MVEKSLKYLASRLENVDCAECREAASLIRQILATNKLDIPEAEHALYNAIWEHLSKAMDRQDFDLIHFDEVAAMETEMAGHVLLYRLSRGWLVRATNAPIEFLSLEKL